MLRDKVHSFEAVIHRWLVRYSVFALRVSLGIVFLGFGVPKYFPGVSPAQDLVVTTMDTLTLGLIPGRVALILVATLECVIGLSLLTGLGLRVIIYLLGLELLGILSPLVLVPARLFAGPYHAPTLEGQYVLKDIILVTAAMVVDAGSFRGARIAYRRWSPETGSRRDGAGSLGAEDKLAVVLAGVSEERSVAELCDRYGISRGDYDRWRRTVIDSAVGALATGG